MVIIMVWSVRLVGVDGDLWCGDVQARARIAEENRRKLETERRKKVHPLALFLTVQSAGIV